MATILPFRALRPPRDRVAAVAAPPYDVVDTAEARALAEGNPDSFLRISRPELELPDDVNPHVEEVYALARTNLMDFVARGVLVRDAREHLFVYRQVMGEAVQTGVVGCASVADYRHGIVATHEHTRPDKEKDRTHHIEVLRAHDEPVFLMYRPDSPGVRKVAEVVASVTAGEPEYDLTTDDGIRHTLWIVAEPEDVGALVEAFAEMSTLYVADGHHRSAAAAWVAGVRSEPGASEFPSVVFPADQLTVMAYNRAVRDLGGHTAASFLARLAERFEVRAVDGVPEPARHEFGLYLDGGWWLLVARPGAVDESDPIARLDVSLLQDSVLAPLLGVDDPRTNERIAFVGGIRGAAELTRLVDSGDFAVAFVLHPTSTSEVMDVADLGDVMPPKSTWFEPKLRSGLFVHPID